MRKLTFLLTCLFLVGLGLVNAQSKSISGKVFSADDGQPVIGATVKVKGTGQGTITDTDGEFRITLQGNAKDLVISYVGMKTLEVEAKSNLIVKLQSDSKLIDEVLVVAYGTSKKSSFTGSASVIKGSALADRQVSNITNALKGQVAGVQVTSSTGQPGESANIRIRGAGSLAASNSPLYVVDGVPFDGDLSSINTADIESTTILKDAAANSLYGARGANGVVLINTKKGSTKEAVISFDARWGVNSRAVSNYNVLTSPSAYLEKSYEAIYNSYMGVAGTTAAVANAKANTDLPTNSNGGVGYNIYTVPNGGLLIGADGKINPNANLGYVKGNNYYQPDNWYNELFKANNLRKEYNLSISGATDKTNYYISGGYLDDSGVISNSGFKRYTTRAKMDYQAKDWLKVGGNVGYTYYNQANPDSQDGSSSSVNLFYLANNIAPIYPLYMRNANKDVVVDNYGFTVYDFGDGTGGTQKRTFMSGSNPASVIALDQRKYISDVFSGRWFAAVDLLKGLKFTYNLGLDIDNDRYTRLYNAFYGQYSKIGGVVYAGSNRKASLNNQQLLTYRKQFGLHDIDILAGHETYNYTFRYLRGSKEKLYNPNISEIDNTIVNPNISSYSDYYSTEGWLTRAQYEYNGKYIGSFSYRRDASSRFAKNNRWGNFGSVGGAWVINKESFMKNLTWVDFLKAKSSYGIQGNDNLQYVDGVTTNYYPYKDQYQLKESNKDFATTLSYKGNPDITWETSYSFNAGVDFSLFKSKLNGTIEYFSKKTKDLLYYKPVAVSNGYSFFPQNIGSILNNGIEIDLNSDLYKSKNINVNLYANATYGQSKILKLAPELNGKMIKGTTIYAEGEARYQMYMQKYAGVSTTGEALYYKDIVDANGNVTGQDKTTDWNNATLYKTGNLMPKVYGGFGLNALVYGFDLNVSFAYQLGGRIYDSGYATLMHGGTANSAGENWHSDILKSWNSTTNSNSDIPRVNSSDKFTNSTSDRFLISSDYLDFANLSLGYNVPKVLINQLKINSMKVFVNASNIALLSARKGLDPRQSLTVADNASYSPLRSISCGVSLTF